MTSAPAISTTSPEVVKVVIVEQHLQLWATNLQREITKLGYTVELLIYETAEDVKQALNKATAYSIRGILIDHNLTKGDPRIVLELKLIAISKKISNIWTTGDKEIIGAGYPGTLQKLIA